MATMEWWKRNNLSHHDGDSKEDLIVVSNDEEEVEAPPSSEESYRAPPLAERIGPVCTGQHAVCSSPGYREAGEQRRRQKLKAEEMELVKGTHAVRKRAAVQVAERERPKKLLNGSPLKRNVSLLSWGHTKRTARRRIEMLEKVPPMVFSIPSTSPQAPNLSLSCRLGSILP